MLSFLLGGWGGGGWWGVGSPLDSQCSPCSMVVWNLHIKRVKCALSPAFFFVFRNFSRKSKHVHPLVDHVIGRYKKAAELNSIGSTMNYWRVLPMSLRIPLPSRDVDSHSEDVIVYIVLGICRPHTNGFFCLQNQQGFFFWKAACSKPLLLPSIKFRFWSA